MTTHTATVGHTNLGDRCLYWATCSCGARSDTVEITHSAPVDTARCGAARRALYQWEREHEEVTD